MIGALSRFVARAAHRLRRMMRRQIHGRAQKDADRMAAEVGVEVEQVAGGRHDAFVHAYVSARLTLAISPDLAERLGNLNERLGSLAVGKPLEAEMDQHNNAVGREIGTRLLERPGPSGREVAEHVKRALDHGRLRVIVRNRGSAQLAPSSLAPLR